MGKRQHQERLVEACGTLAYAVDVGLKVNRALWRTAFSPVSRYPRNGQRRCVDLTDLWRECEDLPSGLQQAIVSLLRTDGVLQTKTGGPALVHLRALRPHAMLRHLLSEVAPEHELSYSMMQSIRRSHPGVETKRMYRVMSFLSGALRDLRTTSARKPHSVVASASPPFYRCVYARELVPRLTEALQSCPDLSDAPEQDAETFLEICRAVDYVEPAPVYGEVKVWADSVDVEYLNSRLFGVTTAMAGFDELFGGGGIILGRGLTRSGCESGARAVLVVGRCGTGKSSLAQQLAVEVAKKGGVSWIMPLEQTRDECLRSMGAMGLLQHTSRQFKVITKGACVIDALEAKRPEVGVLIILETAKHSFPNFLSAFRDNAELLRGTPLSLLIADPVNGVAKSVSAHDRSQLRAEIMDTVRQVKALGSNLLLVGEESEEGGERSSGDSSTADLENMADVVIRLSVEDVYGYLQRFLEIRKSRFQREHRGRHPFRIRSGSGIEVYPSSAAISARIAPRAYNQEGGFIEFGLPSMETVLGPRGLCSGDAIVFQGPSGSMKTAVGLFFVLGRDRRPGAARRCRSLVVMARDSEDSLHGLVSQAFLQKRIHSPGSKSMDDIQVCVTPKGHVKPGEILAAVDREFGRAKREGYTIDRVMVDNVGHWEMSCPFVGNDETFGDTLVDFLRRKRVTSLLVCGEKSRSSSNIQRAVIDDADVVVEFDRFEYRGMDRITVRVRKTRAMRHRRESFELGLDGDALTVKPSSSLLRISRTGEVGTVRLRLFLHSESDMQSEYHRAIKTAIGAVLAPDAEIESQGRLYISKAMRLGAYSAVDELQILQLDEFQLEAHAHLAETRGIPLYIFSGELWRQSDWKDFLPASLSRIGIEDGQNRRKRSFVGLPYYGNVSMLAHREELPVSVVSSWRRLARRCVAWEKAHPGKDDLFFDFPRAIPENFNCLFFEIMTGLPERPKTLRTWGIRRWLSHRLAVEAALILRCLCQRAYMSERERASSGRVRTEATAVRPSNSEAGQGDFPGSIQVSTSAMVWRHWYSTLNQMMSTMSAAELARVRVKSLPRGVCTAGEWYLALPVYSAAPHVGLRIMGAMTSREAELNRLRKGVGLPTRETFYKGLADQGISETPISPYFSLPLPVLRNMVTDAFRRSSFGCYHRVNGILAHHLQRIIELPSEGSTGELEEKVRRLLDSAVARMDFVRPNSDCHDCRAHRRCPGSE